MTRKKTNNSSKTGKGQTLMPKGKSSLHHQDRESRLVLADSKTRFDVEREAIAVVNVSGTGFDGVEYFINAGDSTLFPQASQMARLFTRYKINRLVLHYIPSVSYFSTAGSAGNIVLAWIPSSDEALPSSLAQVERIHKHVISLASERMTLSISAKDLALLQGAKTKKVRGINGTLGESPSAWECGKFFVAWEGVAAGAVGRLEITAEGDLYDQYPVNTAFLAGSQLSNSVCVEKAGVAAAASTVASDLALTSLRFSLSPLGGFSVPVSPGTELHVPPGKYKATIFLEAIGSGAVVTSVTIDGWYNGGSIAPSFTNTSAAAQHTCVSGMWFVENTTGETQIFKVTAASTYGAGSVSYDYRMHVEALR